VCANGWDSGEKPEALPPGVYARLPAEKAFLAYVGRAEDYVKGASRIREALRIAPGITLVAAPGSGFEDCREVIPTGTLSSGQVRALLGLSAGLVLSSRYEGLPLVVLEALAEGLPVATTQVGGLKALPPGLQGLIWIRSGSAEDVARAMKDALAFAGTGRAHAEDGVRGRADANRRVLLTWRDVAQSALGAVGTGRRKVGPTF
jgi:glycosyltransferase involved in cell wall biosynthesis